MSPFVTHGNHDGSRLVSSGGLSGRAVFTAPATIDNRNVDSPVRDDLVGYHQHSGFVAGRLDAGRRIKIYCEKAKPVSSRMWRWHGGDPAWDLRERFRI